MSLLSHKSLKKNDMLREIIAAHITNAGIFCLVCRIPKVNKKNKFPSTELHQMSAFCIYYIFFSLSQHFLFLEYFKVNLSHYYHLAIISMFNVNLQSSNQICIVL